MLLSPSVIVLNKSYFKEKYYLAPVAQWIEHLSTEQKVRGSTPLGRVMLRRMNSILESPEFMSYKKKSQNTSTESSAPVTPMDFYLEIEQDLKEQTTSEDVLLRPDCIKVLNATMGQFPLGIALVDPAGLIVYVNQSAVKIFDKRESSIVGASISSFFGRTSRQTFQDLSETVRKSGKPGTVELNVLNSRKKIFPIEISVSLFESPTQENIILLVFRDISGVKEILAHQHEEEKMNSLQHFISGAAHEIHHPLKGVRDMLQGLLTKYQTREFEYISFKEYQDILRTLETIHIETTACFEIVERMISMNKKKVGGRQSHCDPHSILTETVKNIKSQFELTKISIRIQKKQSLPNIAMSSVDFERVMQNILTNALHSMPAGGLVQIKTSLDAENERVLIECKDNGVGISKEVLSRIFEPFYTTRHSAEDKSSGLGLSIVYATVKAAQGDIDVKSSLRQGTVVTLSLPRYHGRRTRTRTHRPRKSAVAETPVVDVNSEDVKESTE